MKVLILEPADGEWGGFAPIPAVYQPLFSLGNRENVFPKYQSSPTMHTSCWGGFDEAVQQCDVLVAVCSHSTFALGSLVGRAVSLNKRVCALIPTHMSGSPLERQIMGMEVARQFLFGQKRELTRDYFNWVGDGRISKLRVIGRVLAHYFDKLELPEEKLVA